MKIFRNIVISLVCIVLLGYAAYKIAYPFVAPVLFDYLVDRNLNAFVKLEQSLTESLEEEETSETSGEPNVAETPVPSQVPEDTQSAVVSQPQATAKPVMEIQPVKTYMGVFSGEHLARALKNISPADKTRIISLCQAAVSTSDILKVSKMMLQDGLTKEQQKYIENYLRDHLPNSHKQEILDILSKY